MFDNYALIFRVGIAILMILENDIMRTDLDGIVSILTNISSKVTQFEKLLKAMDKVKISEKSVRSLKFNLRVKSNIITK